MISLIIPVYNFETGLPQTLERLHAWLKTRTDVTEIIFVDDGSTDRTPSLLKDLEAPMRTIIFPSNQGKGAAIRAGMQSARGEYVFFTDIDLPYDFTAFDSALKCFAQGADVVLGSRYAPNAAFVATRRIKRQISSVIFSWLANNILLSPVRDTQCGFKAFRRSVGLSIFNEIKTAGFAFDVEVIYRAQLEHRSIMTVPVTLVQESVSSVHVLRDGMRMAADLFRLYARTRLYRMSRRDMLFIGLMSEAIALLCIPILQNLGVIAMLSRSGTSALVLGCILFFLLVPAFLCLLVYGLNMLPVPRESAAQLSRYAVVGLFNTTLNAAIFNAMIFATGISGGPLVVLFSLIAFIIVITQAFFWNVYWTFHSSKPHDRRGQYGRFFLVSGVVALINLAVIQIMVNVIGAPPSIAPTLWANIALLGTIVIALFGNFLGYKFFVFAK